MSVTLHTNLGDIKVELHCDAAPKACEVRATRVRPASETDAAHVRRIFWRSALAATTTTQFFTATSKALSCRAATRAVRGVGRAGGRAWLTRARAHTGTGRGGESIWKTPFADEIMAHLGHNKRGVLSMANSGADTNGSQFFFTYAKHVHLNNAYTVFGRIIDGFETLDLMERVPVDANDKPTSPITLKGVTVHANPIADAAAKLSA